MKTDIISRIESDFAQEADKALEILQSRLTQIDYLNNDRIIRCIIYLSKGSIEELKRYLQLGQQDPRDVMFLAEYKEGSTFDNHKRIRDFNKTFEDCEING